MILRGLALTVFCGAIGAASALLVHPPANSSGLLVRSSPTGSAGNLPPSSVEQVAAKVLPSVVTLQTEVRGQFDLVRASSSLRRG